MFTQHKINGVAVESFDSFFDFVNYCKSNPNPLSSETSSKNWCGGTDNLQDAVSLALNGWHDIRPQVDAVFTDVEQRISDVLEMRFQTMHNYTGFSVDMGRYLQGDPECMLDYVPEEQQGMGRVVKVVVNIAASCTIDPDDIMRRGVAVVALIDTLHKLGVGVEIWADESLTGKAGGKFANRVKMHDSAQMVDIDSLMFGLAHPSMLRRLVFSMQEQSKNANAQGAKAGGGYGIPASFHMNAGLDADVIVDKLQDGHGDLVRDPVGWVLSTVRGLGLIEE